MDNRITIAHFKEGDNATVTSPLFQYDYGQEIEIVGLDLPSVFEVHFSNQQYGDSTTSIGENNRVVIPDVYLTSDGDLYCWIFLHDDEEDGETEYQIMIPITARASITNAEPTPVQQDAITQAIAALNTAVTECESSVAHYPKIENGYWYVWDASENDWVNTNVEASGDPSTLIDDTSVSSTKTYSSEKMQELMLFDVTNVQFPRS